MGAKFARLRDTWSEDPSFMVDLMLPSQAGNLSNERWVGRFQRFSATPTDMWTQYESAIELDAGDAPERITAPSLVMHVIPMPSQGVAAALALLKELAEIGLDIRAGVHAGELEVRDDGDVSGMAVNLAARVEQSARDGELWVSSTVRDMTLGGGVNFVDEGERDLKGIDGRWRLFSTTA